MVDVQDKVEEKSDLVTQMQGPASITKVHDITPIKSKNKHSSKQNTVQDSQDLCPCAPASIGTYTKAL